MAKDASSPDSLSPLPEASAGSRYPFAIAALVSSLATLLLAWPALGGAFLVNPNSDQYIAGYSFREFAAQSLRGGQGFPLWNPFQFGGMPYVAAMHGDIFYPTFLLRLILPTDVAMTWGFILHMVLAGIFTFGFLKTAGVKPQAAMIGGVAYLLSGAMASYASPGHDGKLFVSTLLPAALWAVTLGIRDGRKAAWGALAVIVGLAVLSPHPQLLQYMLLVTGAYSLWLALRPGSVPKPDYSSSKPNSGGTSNAVPVAVSGFFSNPPARLLLALGAVVMGGIMGAVQYLPVREYVAWSPRAGGKGYDYATSFSFPLEETINMYLPQFSGILENYWGRNSIHFHSEYIGVSVLILAFLAFGSSSESGLGKSGHSNRHWRHAWFWGSALVVSLFWAWGGNTPFYHLVYAIVPGTKFFRAPSTILYVTAFAFAVLAAFGAERVLYGSPRKLGRYLSIWLGFGLGVALLASVGGVTSFALGLLGDVRGDMIENNAPQVVIGAWRSMLAVLVTSGVLFAISRGRLRASSGGWVLLLVVALDLWSIEHRYWTFSAPAKELYAEDDIIRYLKKQDQPGRVIALPLGDNLSFHDPFLLGDALMHHGIRGVLGYHGNELGRYQELYGKNDGYQSLANPNFWALANARYFYTNVPTLPFPGSKLVAGPVRDAAGTMTYLFELPGDHPAAWVTPMIVKLDDKTTEKTVLNPAFDVRRVAIFDTSAAVAAKAVNSPLPEPVTFGVTVNKYQPGAIDVTLDGPAPSGSALIVSENYYPGWQATVDGKAAKTDRVDFTLIGVELPEGAKQVQLRFDSTSYHTGKTLTLVALSMAVLWWIIGAILDRRRRV